MPPTYIKEVQESINRRPATNSKREGSYNTSAEEAPAANTHVLGLDPPPQWSGRRRLNHMGPLAPLKGSTYTRRGPVTAHPWVGVGNKGKIWESRASFLLDVAVPAPNIRPRVSHQNQSAEKRGRKIHCSQKWCTCESNRKMDSDVFAQGSMIRQQRWTIAPA